MSTSGFEAAVARDAQRSGIEGVVCGHIHHAEIRAVDGIAYHNSGDWVESNSALIERFAGQIEPLFWTDEAQGNAENSVAEAAPAVRQAS
jgi:UDP-2,3-diacylglucosamine pyrophosphatase LpxH